jgi:hypothetical protein
MTPFDPASKPLFAPPGSQYAYWDSAMNQLWNWGDFGTIDGLVVRGKWKDKQLISAEWVDTATKPHVPASLPLAELSGADGRGVYGFNWWANGVRPNGK